MRIKTVAFAVGMALVLCNLPTFNVAAQARERPLTRVLIVKPTPYWDYNIVPRYRYRAEDAGRSMWRASSAGNKIWASRRNGAVVAGERLGSWPYTRSKLAM